MIIIDGSYNEGGGQMFRSALALSVLFQKQFKITNIRSNRPNPGINNQLLNQISLITKIIKSEVEGLKLGSEEFSFRPLHKFLPEDLVCPAQTAQSITLILQSLLPISINAQKQVSITIHGGTYLNHCPTIQAWSTIFLPIINQMGLKCDVKVLKEGYYPQGGGQIQAVLQPVQNTLNQLIKKEYTKINKLNCTYLLGSPSDTQIFDHQIVDELKQYAENDQLIINSEIKIVNSKKFKKCYGISLVSHSNLNSYDYTIINDSDKTIEETLANVIGNAKSQLEQQNCFDDHHQDQLPLLMALAKGKSEILVSKPTSHTESLKYVIQKFLPECQIEFEKSNIKDNFIISVQGVGYVFE
ncbi:unnamed protein product (macronuclear) [Paramecium tetraurelia]|uniref:RNA 3'-terminal phosphate cyclase domain-containing protein n=1 Tax=Paramecium tetraurelia TaxID=5888 RepID=A0BXD6_PARTE|nr:uncharacterized protein GSPATT00033056001 [Paramecium tetraurelia]CAK63203.1 unnamed protein product [Paramecium tetraurelia]|eukprot:XP_001430601.1 hypothetical protein (macronuclear) [Paramecium tetraurelia strain d4-2]